VPLPAPPRAHGLQHVAGERDRRQHELVAEEVEEQAGAVFAHAQVDGREHTALVHEHDAAEQPVERQHEQRHGADDGEVPGRRQRDAGDETQREACVEEGKDEVAGD